MWDLDRSERFYRQAFGMEEMFRVGSHKVVLTTPGAGDAITLVADPAATALAGTQGGIAHIGFRLKATQDLEEAIRDAEAAGGRLVERSQRSPGVPSAYVADPDGYLIEL